MFARKPTPSPGAPLPADWTESVARLLNETYATECEKRGRYFDVYGRAYPEELLVTASFAPEDRSYGPAVTCFLSCDSTEMSDPATAKKTQAAYVELLGLFYDEILAGPEWDEWEPLWQEVEHGGRTYFYKLSRENMGLTFEADRLLRDAGVDPDEL